MSRLPLIKYLKNDMRSLRMLIYGVEYSDKAKKVGKEGVILDAKEHANMSKMDFGDYFRSKSALFSWYFRYIDNYEKVELLPIIVKLILQFNVHRVASFGAGPSVLEYFLAEMLQDEISIISTDYDEYILSNASKLLKKENLNFETFDFYKDDISTFTQKNGVEMVILIGSSCGMDNETYGRFLMDLRMNGVKMVVTFEAGAVSDWTMFYEGYRLITHGIVRWILNYKNRELEAVHAYRRRSSELKKIYKESGYRFRRIKTNVYPYAYVLFGK